LQEQKCLGGSPVEYPRKYFYVGKFVNIQIVSEFFYPDSFRINEIVEELVHMGHSVHVITALPDYTTGKIPERYRHFRNRREVLLGAPTVHIPTTERRTGVLRRAMNYATFLINSTVYSLFCKKPASDVLFVYETSPVFQVLPAVVLKHRTRKRLVIYCCDIWPECLKAWNVSEHSLLFRVVRSFSGWLYRQADTVAITSLPFSEYLQRVCGVAAKKIVYLPQHCNDDFASIAGVQEENDCTDFLFAGNLGSVQNIECILRAAALIPSERRFCVHLVGDGSELESLKALAEELQLGDRVHFHGRFPASEMPRFYRQADCLLLTLRGGDAIGMTLPSKFQSYLCSGKPIIGAIDGAASQAIKISGCGKTVPAGNFIGLAALMNDVIDHPETYREMGQRGRHFYEVNYTKETFLQNLLNILIE
jgi:glycosyltransferase involved in cell wall biosynthesis